MKGINIILVFVIIFSNCNKSKSLKLADDASINRYFNNEEIHDLYKILNFFDNEIKKGCDDKLFICYKKYFKTIKQKYLNGDLKISKQKEKYLLNSISKSTFNKIWTNGISFRNNHNDTVNIIMIKYEGSYMEIIKDLGKNKNIFKNYYKSFKLSGAALNAGSINSMFNNFDKFNIRDEKERLFLAIHFLTLNNQMY